MSRQIVSFLALLAAFGLIYPATWSWAAAGREGAAPTALELLDRGQAHSQALELDRAFTDLENALLQARASKDLYLEARILLALGQTYRIAGAPRRGIRWIREAIERSRSIPDDVGKAHLLCSQARARNAYGESEEAWRDLDRATSIFVRLGDSDGLLRVASHRALVAVHAGRYDDVLAYGQRVLDSSRGQPEDILQAAAAVAYANHQLGRLDEAADTYDRVIELAWKLNDQTQLSFAYCNRAEVQWQLGKIRPVRNDLLRAITGFEKGRALITGTPRERASFLSRQVAAYDRLIRFLVDTSQSRDAFEIAERFHGRSFLELLDEPALAELARERPSLEDRRQELLAELGRARLELGRHPSADDSSRKHHDAVETELLDLQANMLWRGRDPRRDSLPEPPSQDQVRRGLEPHETLVAYWVAEDRTMIWAMQNQRAYFVQVAVTRSELEENVAAYLEPLRSPRAAEDSALVLGAEEDHLRTGRRLYDWLIGSLPGIVTSAERLILIPDGILHHLPFEALVTHCQQTTENPEAGPGSMPHGTVHRSYSQCSFLGLEKPLAYSPSAGVFLSLRERHHQRQRPPEPAAPPTLLALAPAFEATDLSNSELRQAFMQPAPLNFSRQEVERIGALFPDSKTLVDRMASESRLKAEAGRYRLLHLATHGLVDDDLPMSSGLLLAAGNGEDGLLQAHEVLGLELQADLVALSACRSGRGELGRGEGIVGLGRSFLSAGAASVLVSLWDVDDRSTPQLMEAFYRKLAAGAPAPEALLSARRELFRQQTEVKLVFHKRPMAYAHPRFWAGFVLLGSF